MQHSTPNPGIGHLDASKLAMYESKIGPMSSAEALTLAIEAEEIADACGPFDIATPRFRQNQNIYENYALLLERAGR